jgi:deoxyribose-phosphate aldolase
MNKVFSDYNMSVEMLESRISDLTAIQVTTAESKIRLMKLMGMLDMTTLEGSDTGEKVEILCKAARFSLVKPEYPDAAAVCVYPAMLRYVRKGLEGTAIRLASVAGGFPAGQTSLRVKLDEIKFALDEGADEIDTVMSRGKLIEGNGTEVFDELSAMREACGNAHLKVILETGELPSIGLIRKGCELSILAGADFVKTSTGKIAVGASPSAFLIMLDTCREYLEKTGKTVGVKAAGGIRKPEQALQYAALFSNVMGDDLFSPEYFRIGASSLAGEILNTLGQ